MYYETPRQFCVWAMVFVRPLRPIVSVYSPPPPDFLLHNASMVTFPIKTSFDSSFRHILGPVSLNFVLISFNGVFLLVQASLTRDRVSLTDSKRGRPV